MQLLISKLENGQLSGDERVNVMKVRYCISLDYLLNSLYCNLCRLLSHCQLELQLCNSLQLVVLQQ